MSEEFIVPDGYRLHHFQAIDSTNDEARRLAVSQTAVNTWVVADRQSGGRGRRGRLWISHPGNLYCSLVTRPDVPVSEAARLSFVTAVALVDALKEFLPESTAITCKWPNDVLVNGQKVAGILLESASSGKKNLIDWVIVGIGINVLNFPDTVDFPATSLSAQGLDGLKPKDVFGVLAVSLAKWIGYWRTEGFDFILQAWKKVAAGMGLRITVRLQNETFDGIFQDIGQNGELVLLLDNGQQRRITAGNVFFET